MTLFERIKALFGHPQPTASRPLQVGDRVRMDVDVYHLGPREGVIVKYLQNPESYLIHVDGVPDKYIGLAHSGWLFYPHELTRIP